MGNQIWAPSLLAGAVAGAGFGLLGPDGPQARVALALLLVWTALVVTVGAPALSARHGPARALQATAALLIGSLSGAVALPIGALALGLGYLGLLAVPLVALAHRLGGPRGAAAAGFLGLLTLALPYGADPLLLGLGERGALQVVLVSPLPVLSGSFAGVDLLRTATLYDVFAPGQATDYTYLAPGVALLTAGAAALFGALLLVAPGWRPRPRALAAVALLLVLAAPGQEAQAQIMPLPESGGSDSEIGDLNTRVVLGYWALPELSGRFVLDSRLGQGGSRWSFRRTVDLNELLVLPTFEVTFGWQNAGAITLQYVEAQWEGETQTFVPLRFEEQIFNNGTLLETRYRWRSIAVRGELDIPVLDWVSAKIVTTQRYVKHEVRVRGFSPTQAASERNSFEAIIPTIGAGADVLIWNVISVYGDVQWLDFRTSTFGAEDKRLTFKYREWRAGVRLELVEHAHIMAEYYSIETLVREGFNENKEEYRQNLQGVRVQVAILF